MHTVFSFRDPAPWDQDRQITRSAYAGVHTTPALSHAIEQARKAVTRWSGPRDSVYIYDSPGAYLFVRGRIDTNIIWTPRGVSNQPTIDFFDRRHDVPDVVFMFSGGAQEVARGEKRWRATDPLIEYVYSHYDKVGTAGASHLVFRKRSDG